MATDKKVVKKKAVYSVKPSKLGFKIMAKIGSFTLSEDLSQAQLKKLNDNGFSQCINVENK